MCFPYSPANCFPTTNRAGPAAARRRLRGGAGFPRSGSGRRALLALLACVLPPAGLFANVRSLGDLSIEQLLNESITSVSKQAERRGDAAAAVAVLSNDDLRRSGALTVMDALRLAPGVNVGQVTASQWAISARGFNRMFSNKLLVLVDGRAVYSPLYSGVTWDMQQQMLEDLDRIEIIRGPGATIWGANAVNGVINIVSRPARETQGGLVYAGAGDVQDSFGGVRYGGSLGEDTHYRVFAGQRVQEDYPLAGIDESGGGSRYRSAGFRLDHDMSADTRLTWQGDYARDDLFDGTVECYNASSLGRLTHTSADGSSVEVQAFLDRVFRYEALQYRGTWDTADVSAQHSFSIGDRNHFIWGGGYRFVETGGREVSPFVLVLDRRSTQQLLNVFAQNEYEIVPDVLSLTAGVKVEHNDYTGWEIQPSVRASYKPTADTTIWAAVSRAVRTPAIYEGKEFFALTAAPPFVGPGGGLYVPALVGDTRNDAEVLHAYELGFRSLLSRRVNLDVALFYNQYSGLIWYDGAITGFTPGTPFGIAEVPFKNLLDGQTYGGEFALTISPVDQWRLTTSYSLLLDETEPPGSVDLDSRPSMPRHQVSVRSSHDLTRRLSLDVQLRYVSEIQGAPAYSTADARLAYRVTDALELSLVGKNLFEPAHPEQGPQLATVEAEVPREVFAKATWRF